MRGCTPMISNKSSFLFRVSNVMRSTMALCPQYYTIFSISSVLITSTTVLKLPDEHDNFEDIRAMNKVYVDKTPYIMKLLQSDHRFFRICRPGRFGKSNFLQMLNSFFRGNKKLFEGLSVGDANYDWRSYPVIYFDLSNTNTKSIKADLSRAVLQAAKTYEIEIDSRLPIYRDLIIPEYQREKDIPENCVLIMDEMGKLKTVEKLPVNSQLGQLINALTKNGTLQQSVVILIDEYDWPIRRYSSNYGLPYIRSKSSSDDLALFWETFFYQFVHMERSIKFLLMTCTTKLCLSGRPKLGEKHGIDRSPIFKDISMDPEFSGMFGLTGEEIKSAHFKSHIDAMLVNNPNETFHTLLERLRKRYNGYNFLPNRTDSDGNSRLYNFHSLMSSLRQKTDYFWHPAAISKYAVEKYSSRVTMTRMPINIFSNFTIPRYYMEKSYKPEEVIPMGVSMLLHGYLTFFGYKKWTDEFIVGFPNEEMRESFQKVYISGNNTILEDYLEDSNDLRELLIVGRGGEQKMQSTHNMSSSELLSALENSD